MPRSPAPSAAAGIARCSPTSRRSTSTRARFITLFARCWSATPPSNRWRKWTPRSAQRRRAGSSAEALLRGLQRHSELRRQLAAGVALGHGGEGKGLDLVGLAGGAELLETLGADLAHRLHGRLQVLAR